jgi:hypothetical protein
LGFGYRGRGFGYWGRKGYWEEEEEEFWDEEEDYCDPYDSLCWESEDDYWEEPLCTIYGENWGNYIKCEYYGQLNGDWKIAFAYDILKRHIPRYASKEQEEALWKEFWNIERRGKGKIIDDLLEKLAKIIGKPLVFVKVDPDEFDL